MPAERTITCRAFAKINLDLRVTGVRPDGYHELRTTFQSIALEDTLVFAHIPGPFRIDCDDPACPADRSNLVWRAAEQLWRAARRRGAPRDVTVRIVKKIPMQAGLGGGSSDAAAAIRALAALWGIKLTPERRLRLAAGLGADVPYFLAGGTVLGTDRGDRLSLLPDLPRAWAVVVVPGFGVSTKDAFGWWDRDARDGQDGPRRRRRPRFAVRGEANDLQKVVARRHPIVATLVAALKREGAYQASLSGSGSAVFGLFRRKRDADRAVAAVTGRRRKIFVARTLRRRECRRLAAN